MGKDVNDFFDFGGSNTDYEYDEYSSEPIYDPTKDVTLTESDKGIIWAILAVVLALLIALFVGKIISDRNSPENSYIVPISATYISGLTYSQLNGKYFEVGNANNVDVAKDTVWFLNNEQVGTGYGCYIDMSNLRWGENILYAIAPTNTLEFTIQLEKGQSDDELHNLMSMMVDYPDEWYQVGPSYTKMDFDIGRALARQDPRSVIFNDKNLEQHIFCRDNELVYMTTRGYDLNLYDITNEVPEMFTESMVSVYGDWTNIDKATLIWRSPYGFIGDYTAYKFDTLTNEVIKLPEDSVRYFNKCVYVDITESGNYTILPNHIDLDNIDFNEIKKYDILYVDATIGFTDINREFDIIDGERLDSFDNFNQVRLSDMQIPENTNMVEKLKAIMNSELLGANRIIVIDFSDIGFSQASALISVIGDYWYNAFDVIVTINCPLQSIKSLIDIDSAIIETQNTNTVVQKLETLANQKTYDTSAKISNIQYKENNIQVLTIADSGFDVSKHGYNSKCAFNEELQGSESYGSALFSKLIFTGDMRADFVNEADYLPIDDYSNILPGCNINKYDKLSTLTSMDVKALIEYGLNNPDIHVNESSIESAIYVLTLQQLNETDGVYKNLYSIKQNGSPSFIVDYLIDKITETGPIMANIHNNYGDSTVLITKISREIDVVFSEDTSEMPKIVYYLHMYDPINPQSEQIAKLEMCMGNIGMELGYSYTFEYKNDLIEYNDISIIDRITVAEGKDICYSE